MITITRILCPIDFSDYSSRAFDQAVALAKWYHGSVSVLHVHRLSTPIFAAASVEIPSALMPIALTEAEREQLHAALDDFVAPGDKTTDVHIGTFLDEDPDLVGAILSRAGPLRADLIVIGTHGRSGFRRFILGSVTEKVLRKAACPVLSVPPQAQAPIGRDPASRPRILCPVDFSTASSRALEYAASLAREANAHVTVLHVIELPPDASDPPHPDLSACRAARFEEIRPCLARTIAAIGDTCMAQPLILVGKSYREILRTAADQQADLIAMGVQGRGAVDMAFFGSTTQHVVRQATCPVLTLKALG